MLERSSFLFIVAWFNIHGIQVRIRRDTKYTLGYDFFVHGYVGIRRICYIGYDFFRDVHRNNISAGSYEK